MTAVQVGGASAPPTGLWGHQEAGLARLLPLPAGMAMMGLGSGKTRLALEVVRARPTVQRTLVLCPKAVVSHWGRQAERWLPGVPVQLLGSGPVDGRAGALRRGPRAGIAVANYDAMQSPVFQKAVASWAPDMLVLDECQRLKAPGGKRSRAVAAIHAPYRLGLSGTPLAHSPLDAYGVYRALDPRIFGASWTMFKRRYTEPCRWGEHNGMDIGRGGALSPYRFRNLEEMHGKMMSIAYQVNTRDVLDLPAEIDTTREVFLEPEAMAFYRKLDRELTAEIREGVRVSTAIVLTKLLRLQQATGGWLPDDAGVLQQVSSAKERELGEWLEDLPSADEPCVVFCRFSADIQSVHRAAAKAGRVSLELSGQRNELDAWLRGDAPVLAAQIQAGGLGVELHRAAYGCFFSLGYSLSDLLQARGRLLRPEQARPVHWTHLIASGTVDVDVYAALEKREELLEAVLRTRQQGDDRG